MGIDHIPGKSTEIRKNRFSYIKWHCAQKEENLKRLMIESIFIKRDNSDCNLKKITEIKNYKRFRRLLESVATKVLKVLKVG